MNIDFQPSQGYLASTGTQKGMGVFASKDLEPDEIVEVAPVIILRTEFDNLELELKRRVYNWERLASVPGAKAIALGYGSMYNHGNPANMRFCSVFDSNAIKFYAARAIKQGEELTINYNGTGGEPTSNEDRWFEECDIVPLVSDT